METLKSKNVKARKKHKCNFCFSEIAINTEYHLSTHIYEGSIYDWHAHLRCSKLVTALNMHEQCDEGVSGEDFVEIVKEEFHNLHKNEEDYDIPDFQGQLDFVCQKHNIQ